MYIKQINKQWNSKTADSSGIYKTIYHNSNCLFLFGQRQ